MGATYDLADIMRQETDAGPLLSVKLGKFRFDVPPLALWPDTSITAMDAGDPVGAVRALMGEEKYAAFIDAGGTSALFLKTLELKQGASLPESSASTGS